MVNHCPPQYLIGAQIRKRLLRFPSLFLRGRHSGSLAIAGERQPFQEWSVTSSSEAQRRTDSPPSHCRQSTSRPFLRQPTFLPAGLLHVLPISADQLDPNGQRAKQSKPKL